MNDGASHSELFSILRTHIRLKGSTSCFNISLCNFGTGYVLEYIGFVFSFNYMSTGSVFQVPSVPSKNSSTFY